MTPSGYSGTPQLKKLGIVAGVRLRIIGADPAWEFAEPLDHEVSVVDDGPCDVALVFARVPSELDEMRRWGELIYPTGACWLAWPRKAGGHQSDVDENLIRDTALQIGLVDVKVAAIDDDWSGLKLVWRKENRVRPRVRR